MISFIDIKDRKIEFKTSIKAIHHYSSTKGIKFEDALKNLGKAGVEDTISLFHSSICTREGQGDVKESDIWDWIDEDEMLMKKFMDAMIETMPKNLFRPTTESGQK
jgi:hypothetical protein